MKIGIVTIHKSNNYGACLQAYALWKYISLLGYDCEIIDLHRPLHSDFIPSKKYLPLRRKKRNVFRRLLSRIKACVKPPQKGIRRLNPNLQRKFDEFNENLNYSSPYFSIDDLYSNPPQYDIYISGSDQIWNPTMPYCIEPYFLSFVNNGGIKISYASSLGVSSLLPSEEEKYAYWLASYKSITVREKTGALLLERILNRKVEQVCDPTFLISREQWKKLMKPTLMNQKYILLFTLQYREELLDFCREVRAHKENITIVYLCTRFPQIINKDIDCLFEDNAGIGEFLTYIANAELVVTDSFHGTVFSLILQSKNFLTYVNISNDRSSRVLDLLEHFGLSSHIITLQSGKDDLMKHSESINHIAIEGIIQKDKELCGEYLNTQLDYK